MKKRVLTGINTTGTLHIGNYVGAIRPAIRDSRNPDTESFFFMADLHALIKCQDPARIARSRLQIAATWLAAGLDPERVVFYRQSDIPEIPTLNWLLTCSTGKGQMNRAHAYKAAVDQAVAAGRDPDADVSMGLFCYPILMAADILLYQADLVPVGQDQMQHIEIARDIAARFNNLYGQTFVLPEGFIPKSGARVMSLADPSRKMSKSDENPKSYVSILDPKDTIIKKFKSAVTDSGSEVRRGEDKPGINNLISIYCAFIGKTPEEIEKEFEGKGYGTFKAAVGEAAADVLAPIGAEYTRLMADKGYLEALMKKGKEQAEFRASRTLRKVYKKVGFAQLP